MNSNLSLIHYKPKNFRIDQNIFPSSVRQYFADNYKHPLFHNHYPDGKSIYRSKGVPFQFKVINNEVFILALNEGVEFAESFQWPNEIRMPLGRIGLFIELVLASKSKGRATFQPTEFQCYRNISPYIALNQEKYKAYLTLPEKDRRTFIENGIANHILTAAKWCGITVNKEKHLIRTKLVQMKESHPLKIKDDLYFIPFDIMFECNTELPDYMGIGRFVSRGYGTVVKYG